MSSQNCETTIIYYCSVLGDVVLTVHHNGPLANELVTTLQNAISVQAEPLDDTNFTDLVLEIIK